MNFRILKKDLKRKKSINIILLIFIALATTFIASSVTNMSVILNATDDFFEAAELSDHIIITMSGTKDENDNDKEIREFLENQKNVTSFSTDNVMWFGNSYIEWENREDIQLNNSCIISKYNVNQQKFFDMDDKKITNVEDGTIYISQKVMDAHNVKEGDIVTVVGKDGDCEITFKDLAEIADTINYELACLVGRRVPRIYIKDNKITEVIDYII